MNSSPLIWTIGHSNLSLEQFLSLLINNGIQTLVDVRSIPNSRHVPQFNRKRLSAALAQAGIDYVYMGDVLGGRPQDPSVYRSGRLPLSWAEVSAQIDYAAVMQKPWYQAGLQKLLALASQARVAIMCAEEDPEACHRKHLIAVSLPDTSEVLHIRSNGSLEKN